MFFTLGPGALATEKTGHELYTRPAPASQPSLPVGCASGEWGGQVDGMNEEVYHNVVKEVLVKWPLVEVTCC